MLVMNNSTQAVPAFGQIVPKPRGDIGTVTAAVLGAGPHGRRLISVMKGFHGIELVGIVDRNEEALSWEGMPESVPSYTSTDDLYNTVVPDLVCVATNGPSHAALALEAMDRGAKYVMVEKPMGCSVAECDAMMEKAKEKGVKISVDQIRRFMPFYRWLADGVKDGRWGKLQNITIQRPGCGLGCLGTHSFDMVRDISGEEIVRVTGWVDDVKTRNPRGAEFKDPGGLVILELESGARAVIIQIEDGSGPVTIEFNLSSARIRIDEKLGDLEIIERDLSVKEGPGKPAKYTKVAPPDGMVGKNNLLAQIEDLLKDLLYLDDMYCDASHGKRAVEVLVAAYISNEKGNIPVRLPIESSEDKAVWLPVT
jgi:predicted dehydrogenase